MVMFVQLLVIFVHFYLIFFCVCFSKNDFMVVNIKDSEFK